MVPSRYTLLSLRAAVARLPYLSLCPDTYHLPGNAVLLFTKHLIMKIKITSRLFLLLCLTVTLAPAQAQVKTKIFPATIPEQFLPAGKTKTIEQVVSMPANFTNLLARAKTADASQKDYSNGFAEKVSTRINFFKAAGTSKSGDDNTLSLTLVAEQARNISLHFEDFMLSRHAIMSIYTDRELTDSITAKENNENKLWATRVYQGDRVTITLRFPPEERDKNSMTISQVNFGYKQFGDEYFGNPGSSATCNVNVVCPAATGWENERNSVALIVVNGQEACTGSLLMNTCGSNIPYFLTANHCLGSNLANWVFQFQTWSNTCNNNTGWREDVQFNGSVLRANNAASDFALLELNQVPPPNSGIFYSGWDRSTTTPNGSVTLHHPAGDLMKFSQDFNTSTVSSWGGTNNHWVSVFDVGTVQPGSSGAPLYDMNHRVTGQLHGDQFNQGNYCAQRRGEYGRFDVSWTGGGTNATRLSNWLDPQNTGATTANTSNVSGLINIAQNAYSISGPSQTCTSAAYTVPNLPAGATVQWYIYDISYQCLTSSVSGNTLTINRVNDGNATIRATVTICGRTYVYTKNIRVGGDPIVATATASGCDEVQLSVSGAAPGASFTWTSSNNSLLYGGTLTTYTTSSTNTWATGYNDIAIVTTTNTCQQSAQGYVDFFPFNRQITGLYPEYVSCGDHLSVSVSTTPYDTYYRWYVNDVLVEEGPYSYNYCTCYYTKPDARQAGENKIRVEVETYCGATSGMEDMFFWTCGWYRTQPGIDIYPNPAKDAVNIRIKENTAKTTVPQPAAIREVTVLDKLGNIKKIVKFNGNQKMVTLNTGSLTPGLYFVEISDGKNRSRVQLSIIQ